VSINSKECAQNFSVMVSRFIAFHFCPLIVKWHHLCSHNYLLAFGLSSHQLLKPSQQKTFCQTCDANQS